MSHLLLQGNPDAALVVRTLHVPGGVYLQHGIAVALVLLPLTRVPLLPDTVVQALQGIWQRSLCGKHCLVAFREGVQLQPFRHFTYPSSGAIVVGNPIRVSAGLCA